MRGLRLVSRAAATKQTITARAELAWCSILISVQMSELEYRNTQTRGGCECRDKHETSQASPGRRRGSRNKIRHKFWQNYNSLLLMCRTIFCQILTHGLQAWVVNIRGCNLKSWEYLLFGSGLNTYRTNPPLSQNSNKAWLSFFLKAKSNKAEELNALTGIKSPIDSARWDVSQWKLFLLNFLTCKIWVWWLT